MRCPFLYILAGEWSAPDSGRILANATELHCQDAARTMNTVPNALDEAWIIIADHCIDTVTVRHSFVGILDRRLPGQDMLAILECLYKSFASHADAPERPTSTTPETLSFVYLNDGSTYEDRVVCWGPSPVSLEAMRVYNVQFRIYETESILVQWRVPHQIVSAAGVRETEFWETLTLPVLGTSHFLNVDDASP
jgi:hypothetical protein